jgi:(2R)-3-sulfolactate dehydrogenase (NADP+)
MAAATARALVDADASGLASHGLSRLALYCTHLRAGRAKGGARPTVVRSRDGACLVDAGGGLAYEAMTMAVTEAEARATRHGIACVGVVNSHHAGAMGYHLAPLARSGLVDLGFTNSPAAINAWGGKKPLFGTNPIAACFPRADGQPPLVIDLSLTEVARGKIMLFAEQGKPIPEGWAFDANGKPTTDARAALTGSLAAVGGAKGAMLALTVELLCCALTGAAFGFENDSYFEPGNAPNIGHTLVAIDPESLAGRNVYLARVEALIAAMLEDEGVRLPGVRRDEARAHAARDGVEVSDALLTQITQLAA